jgi:hypothetical protein
MTHIKDQIGTDINRLLRHLLHRVEEGPTRAFYEGRVVDDNDPDQLGRCRIRVLGIFDDSIADKDLPWATPDFAFVGSTVGSFTVPPIGTLVHVRFDNSDFYSPVYSSKALDKDKLPTQALIDYPDNKVIFETDDGDYITINTKSGKMRVHHHSGAEVFISNEGDVAVHGALKVRLDSATEVLLGDGGGYVVTAPSPGSFVTQSGHILTAQEKVRA